MFLECLIFLILSHVSQEWTRHITSTWSFSMCLRLEENESLVLLVFFHQQSLSLDLYLVFVTRTHFERSVGGSVDPAVSTNGNSKPTVVMNTGKRCCHTKIEPVWPPKGHRPKVQKWPIELNFGTHVEDNRGNNLLGSIFQNLTKGTSTDEPKRAKQKTENIGRHPSDRRHT